MGRLNRPAIHVFPDTHALNKGLAEHVTKYLHSIEQDKLISIVLTGGKTPRSFYSLLASESGSKIPWKSVRLYWGDERYVPHNDPESNYRMANESLIQPLRLPSENIFPVPTDESEPDIAAEKYERILKSHFDSSWPRFDLMFLGMGDDCHVASLFPGTAALKENTRWVVSNESPVPPHRRLTMTLPVINYSRKIVFIVVGKAKAKPVKMAIDGGSDWDCPASLVRPINGDVSWWLDQDAAGLLQQS